MTTQILLTINAHTMCIGAAKFPSVEIHTKVMPREIGQTVGEWMLNENNVVPFVVAVIEEAKNREGMKR